EAPAQSVPFLRARLKPIPAPDRKRLARLLAELDSDELSDRDRASDELDKLGEQGEAALTAFLAGKGSGEGRRRAERRLQGLAAPVRDPDQLRRLRALEVLERIDTKEARRAVRALGGASARSSGMTAAIVGPRPQAPSAPAPCGIPPAARGPARPRLSCRG